MSDQEITRRDVASLVAFCGIAVGALGRIGGHRRGRGPLLCGQVQRCVHLRLRDQRASVQRVAFGDALGVDQRQQRAALIVSAMLSLQQQLPYLRRSRSVPRISVHAHALVRPAAHCSSFSWHPPQ